VKRFFESIPLSDMAITDFSIHSIGLILFELKKGELFTSL
jgi:hypothetical protein